MPLSLRQLAFVAHNRDPLVADLCAVFGTTVCCVDEAVAEFGLENAVMPIGTQFLEVVAPISPDAPAARYLDRRGGDSGYMVICQAGSAAEQTGCRDRAAALGVRIAWEKPHPDGRYLQLHPRDTGGCFFEIDTVNGDDPCGPWPPAGGVADGGSSRASAITEAAIAASDPRALCTRWRAIAGADALAAAEDKLELELANATISFIHSGDNRGEGLAAITLECMDRTAILEAATARGLVDSPNALLIGGVRITLEQTCPE